MDVASSSSVISHVPAVEEEKTPKMGMKFDTIDEAFGFYNDYAKLAGFKVRKDSSRTKDREMVWKRYLCSKEGTTDEKRSHQSGLVQRRRCRMKTRENCKAQYQVKKDKSGGYIVCKFVREHSHVFTTPCETFMLTPGRRVMDSKKKLIKTYDFINIQSTHQMKVFKVQGGAYENIRCTDEDVENYHRDKSEEKRDLDAQMLFEHFKDLKEVNPTFIYNIEKDGEDRITRVLG